MTTCTHCPRKSFSRQALLSSVSVAIVFVIAASGAARGEILSYTNGTTTPIVDFGTTTSTISVGTSATISDVDVILDITHTFVSDLYITVDSPSTATGPRILFLDIFTDQDLIGAYKFDDDNPIIIFNAPVVNGDILPGTYRTLGGSLDTLDGENPLGNWELEIRDTITFETGTLNSWTLLITVPGCGPAGNGTAQIINCDVNNDANAPGYSAGGGADTVNINAGTFDNFINGGGGNDRININAGANASNVGGGPQNDEIYLFSGASVTNGIDGGLGSDKIFLNGGTVVNVTGDQGNDEITLNGATVSGFITGGDDNDKMFLHSGSVATLGGLAGNDEFFVYGTFDLTQVSSIFGGNNFDTVNLIGQTIEVANLPALGSIEITNLQNGTTLQARTGSVALNTSLSVDASSGISMQDDDQSDQLTVQGSYTATPGASLAIDALLTTTGGTADMLVVNGAVNGTTSVAVDFTGSAGGSTIPVDIVSFTGGGAGTFALASGPLTVGAFSYDLALAGSVWQLTPSLLTQSFVAPTVQAIVSGDTREIIGSLDDRKTAAFGGGREPVADMGNPYADSKWGTWIRLSGNKANADGSFGNQVFADDASYDSTLGFIQGGVSANFWNDGASKLIASVFGHYSDSNATVSDGAGAFQGTIASTSGGVGGSLTWLMTNGFYADLVGLASWHDLDISSGMDSGSTNGDTLAGSLELGYSYRVNDNVNFVPQAQIVYQRTSIDGYTDSAGVDFAFPDADSVEGRFGMAVEHVSAMHMMDGVMKANAAINVLHDFTNDTGASINNTLLGFDADGTELMVGGGFSVVPNSNGFRFGFQGDYTIPLNDQGREGFSLEATAGIDF